MRRHKINSRHHKFAAVFIISLLAVLMVVTSLPHGARARSSFNFDPYRVHVPDVDNNLLAEGLRKPTALQLQAIDQFRASYGGQATVRWNSFAGSPDVIRGFHTEPSSDTPENTARSFIAGNRALFGVDAASLALVDQKEALGGYLLKFQQRVNGVDVAGGGLGFVMTADKRIRMVMGSTYRDVNVSTDASLNGAVAATSATSALSQYAVARPANVEQLVTPALNELESHIAPALREPKLNIYPTAGGYRLAWNVLTFSRNPFGMFATQVDAANGEVLARENLVRYQNAEPLPYTADIFPNHPVLANKDTGELKLDGKGEPEGMLRVQLRGFNPGSNLTGVDGTLAGPHAFVRNVLATKQPFAQAALGTFHFRQNNAPLESQPNERDDLAEPAEHIDVANIFFFINYLLEYVDDIHRRSDSKHSRIGQGHFPDNYPNSDRPLVGLPHFPSDQGMLGLSGPLDTTNADTILRSALGMDNAFSVPVVQTVDTPAGPQTIVVNPTAYGHGYLYNDLGKDGAVAYHEGMHSISTPIAGLEGAPEGGALNEGQADLWAYTITDADSIGEYAVASAALRKLFRDTGRDPDSLSWIRSARSALRYSQLGTRGNPGTFEVHRDGEIYAATLFEIRQMMIAMMPQKEFLRPAFINGQPTRQITRGQETWERIFLGSLYILGYTAPDTFVKARDAFIEADRILYPTDATDLNAPGQHEALIWQVFAAREMGLNAAAPLGGRQTISTAVPDFALDQEHTGAPQGVTVEPTSASSVRVSWQPVSGAFAYEVLKRRKGAAGERQFKGVPGREYFDGDNATTGWTHIGYSIGASSYNDDGPIIGALAPAGVSSTNAADGFNEMFDSEYAVRALSVNASKQVGYSDLSAGASLNSTIQDVTSAIATTISNVKFANGIFEFDQTIRNKGLSATDTTAYAPINFQIVSIGNPSVTVANADNGGDGKNKPASFIYNQSLAAGATSAPRTLKFSDPQAQMFTFDAIVTARVRGASTAANGSQSGDGDGGGARPLDLSSTTDIYNGIIVVGGAGLKLVNGVDYVDVPFVAKEGAFGVEGLLDTPPASLGAYPDLDFQLLDDKGNILMTSGNLGPKESVGAAVIPGRTYVYRVVGYANGTTPFTITSTQFMNNTPGSASSSSSSFGTATQGVSVVQKLVRFTVNPLTKTVTLQVLR